MLEQKKLKSEGLRYARALQIAVRTAGMFSADHAIAAAPLRQSFDVLNRLLKQTGEFTFGFVDNRVMLGNVLTTDPGLAQLENDFLKRGIAAVRFEVGITFARYKQVVSLLSTPMKLIDDEGGARAFLARHPVEGVKILPAGKSQKRTESGDTLLEMDAEAFLLTRDSAGAQGVAIGEALGSLFESAGMEKPASLGSPTDILKAVAPTLEAALTGQQGDPDKACVAVAQLLQGMRTDLVLSAFAPQRQAEVAGLPPEQMAAELVQDTALNWAARYMNSAPAGSDAYVVEEEVVRVLGRSMRATQMSERLAGKLASFMKEYCFPLSTQEKIQEELRWVALPPEQKHAKLLESAHYNRSEFRRLMEHLRELLSKTLVPEATELANHYFTLLDAEPEEIQPEELSRAPELITAMAGVRTGFAQDTADKLIEALQREGFREFKHLQLVNAVVALSKSAATYEEFDLVQIIGSALEQSLARDSAQHLACCGRAMENLLPPAAMERLIELYLQKREDSAWARNVAIMLRRAGSSGSEALFRRLEEEVTATSRLGLLRLLGRMGPSGIEVTRLRLTDKRWYVVRNACQVLGELKDPELLQQLTPVLQFPEERVQKAALEALIKSRAPGRGHLFAAVLPYLRGPIQERALEEILFLKDPAGLPDLEQFILGGGQGRSALLSKAVHAVVATSCEKATEVLGRILCETGLDAAVRRLALQALVRNPSKQAELLVADFARKHPDDPLANECPPA